MADNGKRNDAVTWGILGVIAWLLYRRGTLPSAASPSGAVSSSSSQVSEWIQQLGSSYYGGSYTAPASFWCAPSSPGLQQQSPYVPYQQMTESGQIIQPPY